jgi:hypothetical protein
LSNILYRELRSTYRWLRTYWSWRLTLSPKSFIRLRRTMYRKQMRDNRVWSSIFNWLRTLAVRIASWPR